MKKVIASAGLVALGALGAQTSHAQLVAGAEKPWSISGTLRGFYDDNYDTQPDGPLRRSSYGFEVRPSAQLNLSTGQNTLNLSYIYSYMYFEDRPNGKADQSHDFELFFNHNFTERYSADFADSFVIAQEPEIIDPNLSAVDRANGNNIRNSAAINFHAQLTRLLGIVFGVNDTFYEYQQDSNYDYTPGVATYAALLNRFENFAHLDTRWQVTDTSTGIFGYMFGAVNYTDNESIANATAAPPPAGYPYITDGPDYVSPQSRNDFSHSIYVGLDHSFRSNLSFSGRAGVQIVDYYNSPAGEPTTSIGPYADLSLNYNYTDGGVVVVGFHNAHNQTDLGAVFVAGQPYATLDEKSSTAYINLTQTLKPISPKLVGTASFQYQNSKFEGGTFAGETDNFYLVGLNLTYQITHFLSSEVGYNYDLLESDVPGRAYNRNRVYIGLTASY